jgi:hypothetical protein
MNRGLGTVGDLRREESIVGLKMSLEDSARPVSVAQR